MRKYLEIASVHFRTQLIWRADTVFHILFTVTRIIFAFILWGAIFEGKEIISGFSFDSMLSYYIISSFLAQIELSGGISDEISVQMCIRDRYNSVWRKLAYYCAASGFYRAECGESVFQSD